MRAVDGWKELKEFCWRFAEVHLHKFTLFILLIVCIDHYCFLNFIPIIFIPLALCLTSASSTVIFTLCGYLALLFIARRVYQFDFIPSIETAFNDPARINCSWEVDANMTDKNYFRTMEQWIGILKTDNKYIASDILGLILVLVLIGIQYCIKYRQVNVRKMLGQPEPLHGILFPNSTPKEFDKSLIDCAKFFLNYGFYKFGMEISLSAMAFAAWLRMDALGAALTIWLLVMIMLPRRSRKTLWPFFLCYLAILLPLQYAMVIGLPHYACIPYPWDSWRFILDYLSTTSSWKYLNNNLSYFLSLANYRMDILRFSNNLKIDFILMAVVAAQNRVFHQESEVHPAGSNESIYKDGKYQLFKQNPHYDFIVEQRSFVDFFKYIVFMYGHWITMIMVLCAGLGGTSLFALGYVVLAFWMLWQGNKLYTMCNYSKTLAKWNLLAYYTVIIMFCKIFLQLIGCVYITLLNNKYMCPVQQLFSIFCANDFAKGEIQKFREDPDIRRDGNDQLSEFNKCTGNDKLASEASIIFDAIAFLFIIFQLRIFHSWFFQRCMIEFRCEVIQANRGAILINQLIVKEMREQTEQQNRKLIEIKERTAAIRKRYEEQQKRNSGYGSNFFTPETYGQGKQRRSLHFDRPLSIIDTDDPFPSYDPRYAVNSPGPAKRGGDYYMFDYDPETDDLVEPVESFIPEVTPGAGDFDKLDPAQLLHTALGKNLNLVGTLDSVEEAEHIKDEKLRMIAAIAPSKKAREIAKRALYHRQHPEQQAGSSLLHSLEEEEASSFDPTSTSKIETEELDEEDMPIIRLRKKGSEKRDKNSEIQPAEEPQNEEEEGNGNETEIKKTKSWSKTFTSVFRFIWKIFINILDWFAAFLNRRSREHRYVAYVLHKEKQQLKEIMNDELYDGQKSSQDLRDNWESRNMHMVSSEADIRRLEDEAHTRWEERNVLARFMTSVGNAICAHTDIICYAFAVYVHGGTAGLITLPLPALVFFWGTLANPRPSSIFWITMILYTEFEIVIKFAFQFGFWPWNMVDQMTMDTTKVYKLQYVLGIQHVEYFAVRDVALLISLFFHRYMLRKLGLWRDANSDQLLVATPASSSPSHSNKNGDSKINSKRKKPNGSDATESTTTESQPRETEIGIDNENIDIEMGAPREKSLPQEIEEMPPSGNPGTTTTKLPSKITEFGVIGKFIQKLIYPKFRYISDFYPLMFFLDILCMFIVAINYSSFGEGGTGNVVNDIQNNRVPIMLVVILLIQSLMIVTDRGLYLRKAVIAKLIYHLVTLILVHAWIFFILPAFTKKEAVTNSAARFLYYVKCIYFLISAWQIRNGYPSLCIGNLLTHSYGLVNMVLFKAFMLTPFVFELRTAIDWTWTDTSMPIFDYFNMENFYATIYNLKCARKFEEAFPAPRGEAKGSLIKYMMGLPLILIMIILIWSPIIAFALINTIGNITPPESAIMTVSLEGFPPLYKMEAKGSGLAQISDDEYYQLKTDFSNFTTRTSELDTDLTERTRMAVAFISQYTARDILKIKFRPESESFWQISPDSYAALKELLENNRTELELTFTFDFIRPQSEKKESQVHTITQKANINGADLLRAIDRSKPDFWFQVNNALPTYFVIPSEGEAQIAKLLQRAAERRIKAEKANETTTYNHWKMQLRGDLTSQSTYWMTQMDFNENITKLTKIPSAEKIEYGSDKNRTYTEFLAMVDRVFPFWLNSFVQGGIILMYLGVILVIGKFLRGFISSQPLDVIVNEIPNPDYLLKICLDIYLVREAQDFVLEQDLFAKLIFLFRSPQTLIKWTRYKVKPE